MMELREGGETVNERGPRRRITVNRASNGWIILVDDLVPSRPPARLVEGLQSLRRAFPDIPEELVTAVSKFTEMTPSEECKGYELIARTATEVMELITPILGAWDQGDVSSEVEKI